MPMIEKVPSYLQARVPLRYFQDRSRPFPQVWPPIVIPDFFQLAPLHFTQFDFQGGWHRFLLHMLKNRYPYFVTVFIF